MRRHLCRQKFWVALAPVTGTATRDGSGDVTLAWVRRARIDGGLRAYVEIPLMEHAELYNIRVMDGAMVKRSWRTTQPNLVYSAAEQTADFSGLQANYAVEIEQISGLVGPGNLYAEMLNVR